MTVREFVLSNDTYTQETFAILGYEGESFLFCDTGNLLPKQYYDNIIKQWSLDDRNRRILLFIER